jgi:hypothetical protein
VWRLGVRPAAFAASAVSAVSAKIPPSPRLSARRIRTTYLSVTTTIRAQKMVETAPTTFTASRATELSGLKTSLIV